LPVAAAYHFRSVDLSVGNYVVAISGQNIEDDPLVILVITRV
jgi:hypothetical protein